MTKSKSSENKLITELAMKNMAKAQKEGNSIKCTIVDYHIFFSYVTIDLVYFSQIFQIPFWDLNIDILDCEYGSYKYLYNSVQISKSLLYQQFNFEIYEFNFEKPIRDIKLQRVDHTIYRSVSTEINGFFTREVSNNTYLKYEFSSGMNSIIATSGRRFIDNPTKID